MNCCSALPNWGAMMSLLSAWCGNGRMCVLRWRVLKINPTNLQPRAVTGTDLPSSTRLHRWPLVGDGVVYLWTLPMFHCNGWCFPWAVTAGKENRRQSFFPSSRNDAFRFPKRALCWVCGFIQYFHKRLHGQSLPWHAFIFVVVKFASVA